MSRSFIRLVLPVLLPLTPFHLAAALPSQQRQTPFLPPPPSQNPLFEYKHLSSLDKHLAHFGTIHVPSFAPILTPPLHINFSMSSGTCQPLSASLPHLLPDVSQALLSTDLSLIPRRSLRPAYVTASINERIHLEDFALSLSVVVEPLGPESGEKGMSVDGGAERWRGIVRLLQRGALELDTAARKRDGRRLGRILLLEIEVAEVRVKATWRFWRIVDGLAVVCKG